jgi:hypothetical protein
MAHALEWPFPGYPADFEEPAQIYRHTVGATAAIAVRLLMLLALVFVFAYAGYRLIVRSSQWSPDGQNCGLPAVLLALFCLALFLATPIWQRIAMYRSQRGDAIVVCPQGVAQYHQGTWHHARWEDIAQFRVVKDTMGKDLVDDSLDGIKDTTTRIDDPDFLSFASLALVGGLWQLLGGNNERYIVKTKTGEEIVFGNTLSDSQKLVAQLRRRAC